MGRMRWLTRTTVLALVAHLTALGCLVAAYINRDDVEIEPVYFERSIGEPAVAASLPVVVPVTPWLILAGCLLLIGTALFLLDICRRRGSQTTPLLDHPPCSASRSGGSTFSAFAGISMPTSLFSASKSSTSE